MPEPDKSILNEILANKASSQGTIKDANQRLIALLDAAVDALVIIDGKGNVELFNSAAQKMFGYTKQEVFGKNIKMLMPAPFSIEHDKYLSSYLASGEAKIIGRGRKVKGKKSNGEEFPIFLSVGEVKDTSHIQFVGIIRDISEQERDRIEARQSRERLSHASRLSSMGELAAGIAHEMNQPLSAISSYAQASKRLLKSATQDNQIKVVAALDKICDQAIRASEVINRLRTFVKKRVAQRETVDLNGLILETVNLAKVDTRILDHEVILELCHDNKPKLLADPVQIQQVLLNLIRNGIDAMEHIKGAPLRIQSQWLSQSMIEVSVIDCGLGIDKNTSSGMFTPFFTTKETGMGMGLTVSQTIIHAHGGRIYFDPGQTSGCIFSFCLPATLILQEGNEK
ncbi:nitrogen regulation protein NR(II) [Paraglaciecola sp. MB-3u-78]|uniref:two-component system sensor histidine kinase NtrB n=1 Tax=Paraglaciecola sp. MB-3u-78 TaxID=2058332 RepID=UPI000C337BB7|nr:PAS domain S-box protein [Paraglaciecola sp. MB-3u-78]PKG99591.1 PAS domain-containing sensor histidine kinase [Paraglaciecola sp. MB-3u-78]